MIELDLEALHKIATERMPALLAGRADELAIVVADASRRPGRDWLAWIIAIERSVSADEAHETVEQRIAQSRVEDVLVVAQALPIALVGPLVRAMGSIDASTLDGWLSQAVSVDKVRVLLIAGTKFAFCVAPRPRLH